MNLFTIWLFMTVVHLNYVLDLYNKYTVYGWICQFAIIDCISCMLMSVIA